MKASPDYGVAALQELRGCDRVVVEGRRAGSDLARADSGRVTALQPGDDSRDIVGTLACPGIRDRVATGIAVPR